MAATQIRGAQVGDGSLTQDDLDLSGAATKATPISGDSIIIVDSTAPTTPKRTLFSAFLGAFSLYIGTTAISLARTSAAQTLSGVTIDPGFATTATAGGTTTLTAASAYNQYFTGTLAQTVVMPVVTTLILGETTRIVNNSTGLVTINSSGANNIIILPSGGEVLLTCILITGTTSASWDATYTGSPRTVAGTTTTTLTPEPINGDIFTLTAQNGIITIANHSVSAPVNGQKIQIRIKAATAAGAITYGTYYRAMGNALPTTTILSKTMYLGLQWNSTDTKWDLIALTQEA